MTKTEAKQIELDRVKSELRELLDNGCFTIYSVTLKAGYSTNGNYTTTAKFWIIKNDRILAHVSYHVATLLHGRLSKQSLTATVQERASVIIKELSRKIYGRPDAIQHRELNP